MIDLRKIYEPASGSTVERAARPLPVEQAASPFLNST